MSYRPAALGLSALLLFALLGFAGCGGPAEPVPSETGGAGDGKSVAPEGGGGTDVDLGAPTTNPPVDETPPGPSTETPLPNPPENPATPPRTPEPSTPPETTPPPTPTTPETPEPPATPPSTSAAPAAEAPAADAEASAVDFSSLTDGAALLVIRPAQAITNPVVQGVLKEVEASTPDFKLTQKMDEMRAMVGADLDDVDHVLVVVDKQALAVLPQLLDMFSGRGGAMRGPPAR